MVRHEDCLNLTDLTDQQTCLKEFTVDHEHPKKHASVTGAGSTSLSTSSTLRHLDVDDFYLLKLLGQGLRLTDAAKALSLSQPAITQRIYKIENALSTQILDRTSRTTLLTEKGIAMCQKFSKIIEQVENLLEE